MANNGNITIYEIKMDRHLTPVVGALGALIGGAFLSWYLLEIRSTVTNDVRNFPAAFHSDPALTAAFGVLKLGAYLLFPFIAATWVYAPIRDSLAKKRVQGKLVGISDFPSANPLPLWVRVPFLPWFLSWGTPIPGRTAMKSIRLSSGEFHVPDGSEMSRALTREGVVGSEVMIYLGAFNRVLAVELVSSEQPR